MKKVFFICFTAISVGAIATTSTVKTSLKSSNSLIVKTLYDTVPNRNSMDTSHKWKNNKNYHSKSNKNKKDSTGNNGRMNNTDSTQRPF